MASRVPGGEYGECGAARLHLPAEIQIVCCRQLSLVFAFFPASMRTRRGLEGDSKRTCSAGEEGGAVRGNVAALASID